MMLLTSSSWKRIRRNGLSIRAVSYTHLDVYKRQPLRIANMVGVGCAALGFLYGLYTIIKKLVNPLVPVGFSALMSAIVFIGGMLMLMLGLIGEYVGRMYICMNNAPQYVIREIVRNEDDGEEQ